MLTQLLRLARVFVICKKGCHFFEVLQSFKVEKAKTYLMLLHLHIVVDRWHCPEKAEDDVFDDIVRILCKFVFSDAVMQKAALVLSASLHISLEERFSNHLPVFFVVTNQYHDVL